MTDEDDGFVKFEVSDWDLEFGSGNHRPKRMSKNQAIYGIWAESESDDDDDNEGTIDGREKKRHDYTTSVSFVKSDKKLQDEVKDRRKKNDFEEQTKYKPKSSNKQQSRFSGLGSVADAEFGQWEMYTKGVGSKLLQKMGYQPGKGLGKNLQGIIEPIEAKKRPGAGSIGLYGPEATSRKLRKGADKDALHEDVDEQNRFDQDMMKKDWKRSKDEKRKAKILNVYTKSTEDIIKESIQRSWNNQNSDMIGMKIIDMTGPEQRVLTGLTQLHQSRPEKPRADYEITPFNTRFDIPELKQNIQRLILLSEKNLVKRRREYDRNRNHIESLNEEKYRLDQLLKSQHEQLKNFDSFSLFVESLEEYHHEKNGEKLTFEDALKKFETFFIDDDLKKQFRMLKIDNLIMCTFNPILRQELRSWHPFDNFAYDYSHLFERLKRLVMKQKTFEILLWDHWNPTVCRALQSWPSMKKNFEPIIAFIDKWRPLLPKWMYECLIVNNLIPRLKSEVDEWNPLTDTISIHSWIHPWLPVLLVSDDNTELNFLFEPIYEVIRMKLSNALTNWHPSDCSARLILEPWKNVFNDASLQSFLDVNVVPKLEKAIQSMVINPNQQSLNEWNWVVSWRTLISLNTIVSILERYFFPKWLNVIYVWLNSGVANFQEISSWYQGWKTLMGDDLVNHATVKEFLKKALIMMDHAVNLSTGLKSFTSYYNPSGQSMNPVAVASLNTSINDQNLINSLPPPLRTIPPSDPANEQINFRQMIEIKAAENGIIFMPMANRFENGRQVFQFGPYQIYIDNQVIFQHRYLQGKRTWQPIRLSDLVDQC